MGQGDSKWGIFAEKGECKKIKKRKWEAWGSNP